MKILNTIISKGLMLLALPLMGGVGGGLVSCETIDEADRWTEPAPIEMKKNVLVEDFTGQKCSNCPLAAALLQNLHGTTLGGHIVAVSIHGGSMSLNINKDRFGLATDQGDEYNVHWAVPTWPAGMIDRTDGKGTVGRTCVFEDWTAAIVQQVQKDCLTDITISLAYDGDKQELTVNPTVKLTEGSIVNLAECKLTLWLTESGIVSRQDLPPVLGGGTDMKYVHNHVLRDCLTNPYGDAIVTGASYSYTIPATYGKNKWAVNPEQMAVVAFVTDKSGEVLQVIDVPVVK